MPSDKSKIHARHQSQKHENHQRKQLDNNSQPTNFSIPTTGLFSSNARHSPSTRTRNAVINVEDIKNRAIRTEELTQRAHRFNYQLAIDLREILQAEFDALETKSADPKTSEQDLKTALIALSNKMTSEIDKQMDVQRKIAEAYNAMYQEVTKMAKQVLSELDSARLTVDETATATRHLSDILNVIRETVDHCVDRPEVSHRKLNDIKRDTPRDSMNLVEMYERLENQIKHCHKALEHPMAGDISISKEFAKLNIYRKLQ